MILLAEIHDYKRALHQYENKESKKSNKRKSTSKQNVTMSNNFGQNVRIKPAKTIGLLKIGQRPASQNTVVRKNDLNKSVDSKNRDRKIIEKNNLL